MKKITVENIKGLKGSHPFDLEKVTVFLGGNGSGKSSVLTAVTSFLTKDVPENFVTAGEKKGGITVEFENGDSASMEKKGKLTSHFSCGVKIKKEDSKGVIEREENLPTEAIKSVLGENQALLDLKADELAKVFSSLCFKKIDFANLLGKMNLTPEEHEYLTRMNLPQQMNQEDFEELYKLLSKASTEARKKEAEITGEISALQSTVPNRPRALAESEATLWKGRYAEAKNYAEKLAMHEESKKRFENFRNALNQKQNELKAHACSEPDMEAFEGTKRKLAQTELDLAMLEKDMKTSEDAKHTFEDILANLNSNVCPISKSIICRTDKTSVTSEVKNRVADLEDRIRSMQDRINKAKDNIKQLSLVVERVTKEAARCKTYKAAMDAYNRFSANAPAVVPAPSPVKYSLEECDRMLKKLNNEIAQMDMFEKGEEKKKERQKAMRESMVIYGLRTYFAPKGRAYNVLGKTVENVLNTLMKDEVKALGLTDEFTFEFEDGLSLYVKRNGNNIPARNLSCGERFITQLILISLINRITQFGYCVIDNIDMLDEANLDRVLDFVTSVDFSGRFKNVIVAGVNHEDICAVCNKRGIKTYMM